MCQIGKKRDFTKNLDFWGAQEFNENASNWQKTDEFTRKMWIFEELKRLSKMRAQELEEIENTLTKFTRHWTIDLLQVTTVNGWMWIDENEFWKKLREME